MANTSGETAATIEVEAREQGLNDAPRADRTPESLADLFAPDVVLPEQFFEGARRDSQASGEKSARTEGATLAEVRQELLDLCRMLERDPAPPLKIE